jgi:hypothetical protein
MGFPDTDVLISIPCRCRHVLIPGFPDTPMA